LVAVALAAVTAGASTRSYGGGSDDGGGSGDTESVRLRLDPSSDQLAECMPDARVNIKVHLTTDQIGYDRFPIKARHLAPPTRHPLAPRGHPRRPPPNRGTPRGARCRAGRGGGFPPGARRRRARRPAPPRGRVWSRRPPRAVLLPRQARPRHAVRR